MTKIEALEFLKSFINRIDTQDNRGTAKPIQYLLQVKRYMVVDGDYDYDKILYYHSDMPGIAKDTKEEAIEYLKEYGYTDKELIEEIKAITEVYIKYYWNTKQAFLTEEGFNKHIELNEHNLGEYRSYVVHSFRDPEMLNLINSIRVVCDE